MINTVVIPKAYSEVYSFLEALGTEYINKIPKNVYEFIRDNRDVNYTVSFDKNKQLETGMITKEALSLISALNLQYWCDDENSKKELKQEYIENYKKETEKYSYENIFKNNTKPEAPTEEVKPELQMVEYKENIFNKVINKIKEFFFNFKKK